MEIQVACWWLDKKFSKTSVTLGTLSSLATLGTLAQWHLAHCHKLVCHLASWGQPTWLELCLMVGRCIMDVIGAMAIASLVCSNFVTGSLVEMLPWLAS
jgi:hypothetical protein